MIAHSARRLLVGAVAMTAVALTSCTGTTTPPPAAPVPSNSSSVASNPAQGAALRTSATPLGTIVVDAAGRTVYVFDKDIKDATASTCQDKCATAWPAVPADPANLTGDGVTGKLGSITGVDGKPQLTLNGWPLYYFAKDAKPGDVTGQAVNNVWWVVGPDGTKITKPMSSSGGY